jgi:recombination protein RecT
MTTNLAVYIKSPEIMQRFQDVLGRGANSYVQSVIIAASDEKLAGCTEVSVVRAALRAASLGLSCDPVQKEAYLVPRNRKIKGKNGAKDTWVKEASFEPHYLGLYKLAMRTGKYWVINVIPVMKGQDVEMGIDGLHFIYENGMKVDHFPVNRVTAKNIDGVQGWLGYFKTTKGFEKTSYMTVDEIMEHAHTFSDAFKGDNSKYSLWDENSKHLATMQMKTVLRDLLKWADTSGDAGAALRAALESSDEVVDAEAEDVDGVDSAFPPVTESAEEESEEPHTEQENIDVLMGTQKVTRESNVPTMSAKFVVDNEIVKEIPHAKALMQLLGIPDGAPADKGLERISLYQQWRKIYAKNTDKDRKLAAEKAITGERPE